MPPGRLGALDVRADGLNTCGIAPPKMPPSTLGWLLQLPPAAERSAHVAGWSEAYKLRVAFEVGKRELLSQELRDILGMGEAPEPIVDDLSEEMAAGGGDDDGDEEEEEVDEPKIED